MRRLTLGGVPLHPALVHFPLTFWVLVPMLDAGSWLDRAGPCWRLGWWFALAGVISALPAVLLGALDAWACRQVAAAQDTLWRHAGLMLLAWTLFTLACLFCSPDDPHQAQFVGRALHGIGALVLLIGAHAGGRLAHVYHLPAACDAPGIPRHSR
jgi:uncharacterized membrane protein